MRSQWHLLCVAFLFTISNVNGANILFYFGISSYSHRIAIWPLVESLAETHNVTFFSPYPPKSPHPKVTEFSPKFLQQIYTDEVANVIADRFNVGYQNWEGFVGSSIKFCELLVGDVETREWMKNSKFDLVFVGYLFNECGFGLVHIFKSKFILFAPAFPFMWTPDMLGHVPETSWIPDMQYHYPENMTLLQKVYNTLNPIYWNYWVRYYTYFPHLERIFKEGLNIQDMPPLWKFEKNVALLMANTHYCFDYGRSLPPVYVSVGGLHITNVTGDFITNEIKDFIEDSTTGGFVFISFGSVAKPTQFPPHIQSIFFRVFKSFERIRFIWKWDGVRPIGMPHNVMTVKWAPQTALLRHHRIKGFITHGGFGSIEEAISSAVPFIIFPIFAEQEFNSNIVDKKGIGIKLEIVGLQENVLHEAISRVMTDQNLKLKLATVSHLCKDRQVKPLDSALWWTEFVLRHNDTEFLKPLGINQTWYERRLLDVWLFIASVIVISLLFAAYLLVNCLKFFLPTSIKSADKKKKS